MNGGRAFVVDVQISCDNVDAPTSIEIESWVVRALEATGREFLPGAEVSVRVVDTGEIRALNRDYRQLDRPTNVLSFPADPVVGLPPDEDRAIGDIVVCADVVQNEAAEQGKAAADHWAHMLVHGALHLVGYDHAVDTDAAEMERLEKHILRQYGVADPYGEPQ